MLYRLQNKKSYFNVGQWERVENQRQKYLNNIQNYRGFEERDHFDRMDSTLLTGSSRSYYENIWGGTNTGSYLQQLN